MAQFVGSEDWAEKLTRTVVRGWVAWYGRKAAATTVGRSLHALKASTSWLPTEGVLSDDVCYGITSLQQPRKAEKLPDVPSQEEMATLLNGDFPTAFPERDRLLLLLMYGDGLRVSEAANLKLDDFRPEQNAFLINGKGGMYGKAAKQRLVPPNGIVREALDNYLIARAKALRVQTNVLFFAMRNRYALKTIEPISARSIRRMLLYMTEARGLQPMHPHLLRHACATHMLKNDCPLDVIAKVLGHDNIDITAHYAQVTKRLMRTYNAAHPHARPELLSA